MRVLSRPLPRRPMHRPSPSQLDVLRRGAARVQQHPFNCLWQLLTARRSSRDLLRHSVDILWATAAPFAAAQAVHELGSNLAVASTCLHMAHMLTCCGALTDAHVPHSSDTYSNPHSSSSISSSSSSSGTCRQLCTSFFVDFATLAAVLPASWEVLERYINSGYVKRRPTCMVCVLPFQTRMCCSIALYAILNDRLSAVQWLTWIVL